LVDGAQPYSLAAIQRLSSIWLSAVDREETTDAAEGTVLAAIPPRL